MDPAGRQSGQPAFPIGMTRRLDMFHKPYQKLCPIHDTPPLNGLPDLPSRRSSSSISGSAAGSNTKRT